MNRENVQHVRDRLVAIPAAKFHMSSYFGERDAKGFVWCVHPADHERTNREAVEGSCGSCVCIAGHALATLAPDELAPEDAMIEASALLGLSRRVAVRLFEPHHADRWFESHRTLDSVTLPEAVRVLDHLLATGRVKWSLIGKPVPAAKPSAKSDSGRPS